MHRGSLRIACALMGGSVRARHTLFKRRSDDVLRHDLPGSFRFPCLVTGRIRSNREKNAGGNGAENQDQFNPAMHICRPAFYVSNTTVSSKWKQSNFQASHSHIQLEAAHTTSLIRSHGNHVTNEALRLREAPWAARAFLRSSPHGASSAVRSMIFTQAALQINP
jgi:hypothetical protein